jgi:hypothetical protein
MRGIIISAIQMAVLSSLYIAAGLRLLLAKKPLLVEHRWWIFICLGPLVVYTVPTLQPEYLELCRPCASLIIGGIACIAIGVGISWWISRGGIIIGVTGMTLRDALRQAFSRQGLSYEESAKAFLLPALNNELIIKATLIDGMFSVHFKKSRNRRAFRQLAAEVNDFFKTAPVRTNRRVSYALIVIGAAFLLVGSWLTYERLSFQTEMRSMREAHKGL